MTHQKLTPARLRDIYRQSHLAWANSPDEEHLLSRHSWTISYEQFTMRHPQSLANASPYDMERFVEDYRSAPVHPGQGEAYILGALQDTVRRARETGPVCRSFGIGPQYKLTVNENSDPGALLEQIRTSLAEEGAILTESGVIVP